LLPQEQVVTGAINRSGAYKISGAELLALRNPDGALYGRHFEVSEFFRGTTTFRALSGGGSALLVVCLLFDGRVRLSTVASVND
jgi:hypothetical protein